MNKMETQFGRYTVDEDGYLALGVAEFGEGKWAEIRNKYIHWRTSTSLKDRWRTLKNHGNLICFSS